MIAAVILAAGASTRLGEPKQSLKLGHETLLERTIRVAREAELDPVFAVVAPELFTALGDRTHVLINHEAAEGIASSIRTGIAAAIAVEADGAIILACDQPFVTSEHLRQLARSGDEIVASAYAGRNGVPAYFPVSAFKNLLKLRGDIGARAILREVRAINLKKGELDIDTAEDLKRVRELYASESPL